MPEQLQDPILEHDIMMEGDFRIKEIALFAYSGNRYDITHLRVSLKIFEDIFTSYIGGEITLQDNIDLPHLMPLIGEERIKITFTRPGISADNKVVELENVSVDFRVYKMGERENIKDRHQTYTLYFVSEDWIKNFKTKVLKSYVDMPYSDMVSEIFSEKLGTTKLLNIEPTKHFYKMAIPNMTPLTAINMLASRSESDEGNGCLYFCFEDRDQWNFCTIGKLFDSPPVETYTYGIKNVRENDESRYKDRTIEHDLRSLENYGFSESFDVLKGLTCGLYGSSLLTYDPIRRLYETIEFDYDGEFESFKHLDKNKPFTSGLDVLGSPLAHRKFLWTNKGHDRVPWIVAKERGILPNHVEDFTLYRQSQIHQIESCKVLCTLPGDPRRKIGQVVEFLLPHQQGNWEERTQGEPYDNYLSGKYLITAVTHRIEQDSYWMDFELIKDTYYTEIKHRDPLKEYDWTY